MTQNSQIVAGQSGRVFGVPVGDFGWFASLLITLATGFMAFFAATFLSIVGMLFYSGATHKPVNYADTYLHFGLPCGIVVLLVVGVYLGTLWVKRISRRA